ncbi:Cathepsin L [Nymphon striatum]|nr:Cathepsin L [Nymphon striatum]
MRGIKSPFWTGLAQNLFKFIMLRSAIFVVLCSVAFCHYMHLIGEEEWNLFKVRHDKSYKSPLVEQFRRKIYNQNRWKVVKHNQRYEKGIHSYRLEMNQFGDMLAHEFASAMNGLHRNYNESKYRQLASTYISPAYTTLPDSIDWRKKGAVTPVKNQGECGSCWSFSATGALEGQHFRKTGRLVSLSEQNLIDCSSSYGNQGCQGGLMDPAFEYIKANGGIDTEKSYPYEGEFPPIVFTNQRSAEPDTQQTRSYFTNGGAHNVKVLMDTAWETDRKYKICLDDECHFHKSDIGATDSGFVDIPLGREDKLKDAVANIGPISVGIDASRPSFQFYKDGLYNEPECSSEMLDHGVLVVGYGTMKEGDYWLVKNSWGASWGIHGYIKMSRNVNNQCGIATAASYPLHDGYDQGIHEITQVLTIAMHLTPSTSYLGLFRDNNIPPTLICLNLFEPILSITKLTNCHNAESNPTTNEVIINVRYNPHGNNTEAMKNDASKELVKFENYYLSHSSKQKNTFPGNHSSPFRLLGARGGWGRAVVTELEVMKTTTAAILIVLCSVASCHYMRLLGEEEWNLFKVQHGKSYKDSHEEEFRKKIYVENRLKIVKHNQQYEDGDHTYRLGMNEFGDMLPHEFTRTMNGLHRKYNESKYKHLASTYISPAYTQLPENVDWRTKGAVTPVKNQGQCGSCWSFSTTGSLEGQHFRKSGKLVSLSEQNLIDCSTSYGNHGCEGGLMDQAFQYIKENGGIDTEKSYPYEAEDDRCNFKKTTVGASDSGFVDVPAGREDKLKEAAANIGPISVAIDASHQSFQFYKDGLYNEPECSSEELDHGVLVVGYGTMNESGGDYWLVKNSWGEGWGLNGYIKMSRNVNNQCGIATSASYPLV